MCKCYLHGLCTTLGNIHNLEMVYIVGDDIRGCVEVLQILHRDLSMKDFHNCEDPGTKPF